MKKKKTYIAPQAFVATIECSILMSGSAHTETGVTTGATNQEVRHGTNSITSLAKGHGLWDDEDTESPDDPWSDGLW